MPTQTLKTAELCSATYRAQQVPGMVILTAMGLHPTTGYTTFFERAAIDVFPPEFSLWHVKPSGILLQLLTPFVLSTSFEASEPVATVVVHDAQGKHSVPVEQVPDLLKTVRH